MVYHGKHWYIMVQCDPTMVHPCVTMMQAWYKTLVPWYIMGYHGTLYLYHIHPFATIRNNLLVPWYIDGIPSFIFIPPWHKYLIPWYVTVYHGTTLCNCDIIMPDTRIHIKWVVSLVIAYGHQVQLRTEVPRTPSSTRSGLELMTSRS